MELRVSLSEMVGGGYSDFWRFTGRYRVLKGSRASKKSKTMALWVISKMHRYPEANTLVVRKTFRTLKDSCFTELKWAINRLNLAGYWKVTENPLEMTRMETGQKIYFRGLDDPLKVTSITVDAGHLCWMWIEEAYELMREADFDMIDESIRGRVADGLFKQVTLTFNPWNERHWIRDRFFREDGIDADGKPVYRYPENRTDAVGDILAKTVTYKCNEWLDDTDERLFETMRQKNPRRYRVAGLGEWGITEGLIFENWREEPFALEDVRGVRGIKSVFGLDFGYTNDPSALFCGMIDVDGKRLWVFDEMYEPGLSNRRIAERIRGMGLAKERIVADSAEPKSIDELDDLGLHSIRKARKGRDSVAHGIQFLQDFEILIHPSCVNFMTEISNYSWDEDRHGKKVNKPADGYDHLMDAMRYAVEDYARGRAFSFD